jgi:F0F1-type ATP synthase delta subunit
MNRDALHLFTKETYRRSDFAYRLSVVREFFEYAFFTKRVTQASVSLVDDFVASTSKTPAEAVFLKSLPDNFLSAVTQASFYNALDTLEADYKKLDTITLTVPVLFSENDIAEIGQWVRREIAEDLVLECTVDASIIAGCRVVWRAHVYDFSFEHYFEKARENIRAKLVEKSGVALS